MVELLVLAALSKNSPPAANRQQKLTEVVLIYSEEEKKWIGPFIVADYTGLQLTVPTLDGKRRQTYSSFLARLYFRTDEENLQFFCTRDENDYPNFTFHLTEIIEPNNARALKFDKQHKTKWKC